MRLFRNVLLVIVLAALAGSAYALVNDQSLVSGELLPVVALPEPADWMTLLCGLAVAAFIARRKTSQVTG